MLVLGVRTPWRWHISTETCCGDNDYSIVYVVWASGWIVRRSRFASLDFVLCLWRVAEPVRRACRCLFLARLLGQLLAKNLSEDGLWAKNPSARYWCPSGTVIAGGPVRPIDVAFAVHWELVKCVVCTALCNYTAHCDSLEWCGWGWWGFVVWERGRTVFGYFGCPLPSCCPAEHFICWLLNQQVRLRQSHNECVLVWANCWKPTLPPSAQLE